MSDRQPRSEPWAFWIVVAIALLAMFALNGCAVATPEPDYEKERRNREWGECLACDYDGSFGVEKEMVIEDPSSYSGYYRYNIVKARCVATVKAKYPWSCYYNGTWYWVEDGVGTLQNDRTGYY